MALYYYGAFGLSIESAIALPELVESLGRLSDVVIRIDRGRFQPVVEGFPEIFELTQDGVVCVFREATYLVRGGREIIIDPAPEADERLVRLPLLGTVFAILLHQRGRLVLHGSTVSVDGRAATFLGHKGRGKSTISAMLYGRGHRMLSDDVSSVDLDLSTWRAPVIYPGFPVVKLWPDAAASTLGDDPASLPRVVAQSEKRARRVDAGFSPEPVTVGAIYILAEGDAVAIEPLSRLEATFELITHSFVARLGSQALQGDAGKRHLEQCARLARNVPCYRLARPRSVELLGLTARLVTDHMRGQRPEKAPAREMASTPVSGRMAY